MFQNLYNAQAQQPFGSAAAVGPPPPPAADPHLLERMNALKNIMAVTNKMTGRLIFCAISEKK